MDENTKRRLTVAYAIAQADNPDIDGGEMGFHFWGKYREAYLKLADRAIEAMDKSFDDDLLRALQDELSR
ncbi:hypothetical protein G6M04_14395 [Agrobacterium rhizogenes]|uniref:hypothetical protein n=1 Tax=Rhizobium rhizogenes TaxID=359 RepID=UPI001571FB98|nr:hypothetical protein [Rhizobium rhizogenes]NTG48579.1 hypothetical protein [Rhizobium rhizogenes]